MPLGWIQILISSILEAGTCQILSLATSPRWSQVWQKLLCISRLFEDSSCVRTFHHVGNCKQINIPCGGKNFLWGEQVQGGGGGGDNFRSTVPPPLLTPQLATLSIVMCPAPSIRNSGFWYWLLLEISML